MKFFPVDCDIPSVIFSLQHSVRVYTLHTTGSGYSGETTEIHNVFGTAVDMIDYKVNESMLGVALGPESWGGNDAGLKVNESTLITKFLTFSFFQQTNANGIIQISMPVGGHKPVILGFKAQCCNH